VSEASVNRNRSTIIVPAGSSGEEGWELFRNLLAEINEAVTPSFYTVPNQVLSQFPPLFDFPDNLCNLLSNSSQ
jgi:transcriptional activator protein Pur-alpha